MTTRAAQRRPHDYETTVRVLQLLDSILVLEPDMRESVADLMGSVAEQVRTAPGAGDTCAPTAALLERLILLVRTAQADMAPFERNQHGSQA